MARKGLPLRGDTLPLVGRLWREWMRPHARSLAIVLALIAVFLACFRSYTEHLGPGEKATVLVIATDRRQARTIMRYTLSMLEGIELLPEANASDATSSLRGSSSVTGTAAKAAAGSAAARATSEAAAVNATAAKEKIYYLRVLAGTLLSKVAQFAATQELAGMEALRGIPGTLGGAVTMNAGAYGTEMKDVLYSVDVLTPEGELQTLTPAELALGYRHSVIPERGYIVVAATLALRKGDPDEIQARMADFQNRRKEKQPLDTASAGSTFKRPEGYFAGKLIEDTGLRGFRHGGAQVSEKHCGFVINDGTARAADIYWLIGEVRKRVLLEQHVELTPEVKIWGNF